MWYPRQRPYQTLFLSSSVVSCVIILVMFCLTSSIVGTMVMLEVVITPNVTSPPPTFRYFIDENSPMDISLPERSSESDVAFQTIQLDYPGLPDAIHNVNLTILQISSNYPFLLDSFAFRASNSIFEESIGASSSHSSLPMGAIIGGSIAGITLALGFVGLAHWWRRRERRPRYWSLPDDTATSEYPSLLPI